MNIRYLLLVFTIVVVEANADSSTLDAAIGGGIGGAAGAAIGNELGGRDGAIVGGALGGAIGAAVNTDDKPRHTHKQRETHYVSDYPHYNYSRYNYPRYRSVYPQHVHPHSRFCPPGQAKKGRC